MINKAFLEWKFQDDDGDEPKSLDPKDINMFLDRAMQDCPWHKAIPQYTTTKAKNYINHWKIWFKAAKNNEVTREQLGHEFNADTREANAKSITAKRCPGILGILSKSYIVKSPVEFFVHIEDGEIASIHNSDNRFAHIESHNDTQYKIDGLNLFKNKKSLKVSLPVAISCKLPYVFLNPVFHKDSELEVIPGVIEDRFLENTRLIFHCFVDTSEDKYIHVKAGDPIAYMWFPSKTRLKRNIKLKDKRYIKSFNRSYDFMGK